MTTPYNVRRTKVRGCAIHGHVMTGCGEEETPLANDPIYESRILRYYRCVNCHHTEQAETLTLKDDFIAE